MTEVERQVNNEILRHAVSLAMFCVNPKCQRSLDYRKAAMVELLPNNKEFVLCLDCLAKLEKLVEPEKLKSITRYEK